MAALRSAALEGPAEPAKAMYEKLNPGPGKSPAEVADHQRARIHSAMIEVVAERGYGAVTLRELARLAGVSSRAFYKHYASKEECFLRTHELIVRRIVRRIVAAQAAEPIWQKRLRAIFAAFFEEMARDPRAARLILVDAYCAGTAARERARRADHTFEARFKSCFDRNPSGGEMPPILIKAIVAGVTSIARSRLVTGREAELPELADEMTAWVLGLYANAPDLVAELDRQQTRGKPLAPSLVPSSKAEGGARAPTAGVRALLLVAVAKLAASEGYENLTIRRIRQAAGASPRSFSANFEEVEDCFLAAVEEMAREAFAEAAAAQAAADIWEQGVQGGVTTICARVAADPLFARICFEKVLSTGINGAKRCASGYAAVAGHLTQEIQTDGAFSGPSVEASVGAASGLIEQQIALNNATGVTTLIPTLTYVLTSSVGSTDGCDA